VPERKKTQVSQRMQRKLKKRGVSSGIENVAKRRKIVGKRKNARQEAEGDRLPDKSLGKGGVKNEKESPVRNSWRAKGGDRKLEEPDENLCDYNVKRLLKRFDVYREPQGRKKGGDNRKEWSSNISSA